MTIMHEQDLPHPDIKIRQTRPSFDTLDPDATWVRTVAGVTRYTVGELAGLAGVSVRLLHHYDEIGLLVPGGRTPAGYRQYGYPELERLQRILAYRELGLGLDDIATVLDDPAVDPVQHLRERHRQLTEQIDRLQAQLAAVQKTMEAHQMGIQLDPQEMFEVFGDHDPTRYEEEVRQRWGDTDAYRESHRRTGSYSTQDWLAIKAEVEQVGTRLAEAMRAGLPADSVEAMDAAEAHRQHISTRFYDCGYDVHRGLAAMYLADPRFTANYEKQAPGLAQYIHDAIQANADRAG
jgi:DNA-binding transcriptional MerR regulator